LIKKSIKDSVAVLRSDSAGNKTKTWNYITKDSILLADTSLNTAKKMLLTDIGNANNILGLGRQWKDSCKRCKETMALISEINKNSSPEKKQQLAKLLSENNGVCTDKSCVNSRKCLQWHPLQRGGIVTIAGWIIMALGISLGAPFWFDMLNKIMQLRGAIKPKESDNDSKTNPS
ncbi:MAG: hypothetical protein ACXVNN_00670, partial [Bacteroidia bacterium]